MRPVFYKTTRGDVIDLSEVVGVSWRGINKDGNCFDVVFRNGTSIDVQDRGMVLPMKVTEMENCI